MSDSGDSRPYPAFANDPDLSMVTSHAEARRVLLSQDYRPVGLVDHLELVQRESGKDLGSLIDLCRRALVFQWGDEHLRLRRLLPEFFGRRGMEVWRPTVHAETRRCLDGLDGKDRIDVVEEFADPLFAALLPTLLGVSVPSDRSLLERVATARHFVEPLLSPGAMLSVQEAFDEILEWVRASVGTGAGRVPRPFLQELVEEGVDVEDPSILGLVAGLLVAAHTTSETMGFIVWRLLRAPAAERAELSDPERMRDHLERLLRLYPSTLTIGRQVRAEAGGECPHAAGEQVWIHVPSVNRDESVFPPVPEEGALEGEAEGPRHLSFGAGPHKCPGAAFARLVIGVAVPALLRYFPHIRLVEDEVRWLRSPMIHMPAYLPCELAP